MLRAPRPCPGSWLAPGLAQVVVTGRGPRGVPNSMESRGSQDLHCGLLALRGKQQKLCALGPETAPSCVRASTVARRSHIPDLGQQAPTPQAPAQGPDRPQGPPHPGWTSRVSPAPGPAPSSMQEDSSVADRDPQGQRRTRQVRGLALRSAGPPPSPHLPHLPLAGRACVGSWQHQGFAGLGLRCWIQPTLKAAQDWLGDAHEPLSGCRPCSGVWVWSTGLRKALPAHSRE